GCLPDAPGQASFRIEIAKLRIWDILETVAVLRRTPIEIPDKPMPITLALLVVLSLSRQVEVSPKQPNTPALVTTERRVGMLDPSTSENLCSENVYVDPTQRHFAYIVKRPDRQWVVLDDKPQQRFDSIEPHYHEGGVTRYFLFSPDGRRL